MANKVIHSMQATIIAKTEGKYVVKPEDSMTIELIPFEAFSRCRFPENILDEN